MDDYLTSLSMRESERMSHDPRGFQIGDVVSVEQEIADPDTEAFRIGGWQGRILEIRAQEDETSIIDSEWDRIRLPTMPQESIERCEEQGLDWTQMGLFAEDLELAEARDTEEQVQQVRKEIDKTHYYSWLGEEGKRIEPILAGIDPDDEIAIFEGWEQYLEQHLSFPFEAVVNEWQERGSLKARDTGSLKSISMVDELYGVIVELRVGRKKYE
jgi:hypothetical protein